MIEYITKNWTYFVAFATVIVYIFEKSYSFWTERKKKQQAYNRTFVAIVKFFYSYQKHKSLYAEKPLFNLPENVFHIISKHIDTFNNDLENFKESIIKESEIIPEISIEAHFLFEFADRIRIMDKMSLLEPEINEMNDRQKLIAKKALFYAMKIDFENFFGEVIPKVQKRADVEKKLQEKLSYFGTEDYEIENLKKQKEVINRYLESMLRQGAFQKEESELILQQLINEK